MLSVNLVRHVCVEPVFVAVYLASSRPGSEVGKNERVILAAKVVISYNNYDRKCFRKYRRDL